MSIDFEGVTVPELPDLVVLGAPPVAAALDPPGFILEVGPPGVEFVSPPDDDAIRVIVGPGGSGGSSERVEFTVIAGFNLQAFRLVVPRVQAPNVRHAMPNFLPHANRPLWMTLHAALAGEPVNVVSMGKVVNTNWDWMQGPIYLGLDGTLTQTIPEPPTFMFAVQVGFPVDPDSMYLEHFPATVFG